MMRMLVAECKQEVSTFNPTLSHTQDFQRAYGAALVQARRSGQNELAGALNVFATRPDVEVAPAFSAVAISSGGVLAAPDWHWLDEEFLTAVQGVGAVDAASIALHGAMAAQDEGDPEGYLLVQDEGDPEGHLLVQVRQLLGAHVPLIISLDLHGILTARLLEQIDALTVYHTYPHEDMADTGARAARLLLRLLDEGLHPATALVPIPALVRGPELVTRTGLFGRFMRECAAIEASPGGLAAGLFIGNPFTDVPDLRSTCVVITTGAERAARAARRLAEEFWAVRAALQEHLTPREEAGRLASQTREGTVVLMDAADATSSGASGDSNALLRACLEGGYRGRALLPLIDPRAAAACVAAGVGQTVRTPVGGAFDPARFPPIELEGRVHLLAAGRFIAEFNGAETVSGPTAVLQAQNSTLVLGSRPVHLHDRSFYLAPLLLPGTWTGPAAVRPGGGEVPALQAAHVPGVVRAADHCSCTGVHEREPALTGAPRLPAPQRPARRRRHVHAAGAGLSAREVTQAQARPTSVKNGVRPVAGAATRPRAPGRRGGRARARPGTQ